MGSTGGTESGGAKSTFPFKRLSVALLLLLSLPVTAAPARAEASVTVVESVTIVQEQDGFTTISDASVQKVTSDEGVIFHVE